MKLFFNKTFITFGKNIATLQMHSSLSPYRSGLVLISREEFYQTRIFKCTSKKGKISQNVAETASDLTRKKLGVDVLLGLNQDELPKYIEKQREEKPNEPVRFQFQYSS
jgi:putative ABC transport system permease protein